MAPAVSMEYWQNLANQYSQHLMSSSSEKCVPFLVGSGKDADAIEFYLQRRRIEDAMIVAKYSLSRVDKLPTTSLTLDHATKKGFDPVSPIKRRASTKFDTEVKSEDLSIRERSVKEETQSREMLLSVVKVSAVKYLDEGKPKFAVAQFIAAGEFIKAIDILVYHIALTLTKLLMLLQWQNQH
jgi:hypothetical protein